ncbi:MAG: hypothetical protein LBV67_07005 [Streptococcaceae bacterium]|jgi:hypothetical protein|nr:hypothetical protein [Streptococcaceae bacterium]
MGKEFGAGYYKGIQEGLKRAGQQQNKGGGGCIVVFIILGAVATFLINMT